MTLERASELIKLLPKDEKIELFYHFAEFFDIESSKEKMEMFAAMCGFGIAKNVRIVEK